MLLLFSSNRNLFYYLFFYASLLILYFLLYSIITQLSPSLSPYVSSISIYSLIFYIFFKGERCLRPNISINVRFNIKFNMAFTVAFKKNLVYSKIINSYIPFLRSLSSPLTFIIIRFDYLVLRSGPYLCFLRLY